MQMHGENRNKAGRLAFFKDRLIIGRICSTTPADVYYTPIGKSQLLISKTFEDFHILVLWDQF
jgi:hypothetical protein